jgi:hypothetical protein
VTEIATMLPSPTLPTHAQANQWPGKRFGMSPIHAHMQSLLLLLLLLSGYYLKRIKVIFSILFFKNL